MGVVNEGLIVVFPLYCDSVTTALFCWDVKEIRLSDY